MFFHSVLSPPPDSLSVFSINGLINEIKIGSDSPCSGVILVGKPNLLLYNYGDSGKLLSTNTILLKNNLDVSNFQFSKHAYTKQFRAKSIGDWVRFYTVRGMGSWELSSRLEKSRSPVAT